jgi:diguanylate cyclase (GGDEF)-like protein
MNSPMSEVSASSAGHRVDETEKETLARLRDENLALKARIEELEQLADTDPLTPLPNRRAFVREAERAIARAARYGATIALMYIDVDHLKRVNDAHGHGAGDSALRHLAALLRTELRAGDFVARIGGDEFAVLAEPVDPAAAVAKGAALQNRVSSAAFDWHGQGVHLGISVGVTMVEAQDTVDALLARADAQMYAAKNGQRSDR